MTQENKATKVAEPQEKEELFQKINVQDAPFTLICQDGIYKIACANHIVSRKEFENEESARKYIKSRPWELIVNLQVVIYGQLKAQDK